MEPLSGVSSPVSRRSSVVLPAPFAPTTPMRSSRSIAKVISSSTVAAPNVFVRCLTCNNMYGYPPWHIWPGAAEKAAEVELAGESCRHAQHDRRDERERKVAYREGRNRQHCQPQSAIPADGRAGATGGDSHILQKSNRCDLTHFATIALSYVRKAIIVWRAHDYGGRDGVRPALRDRAVPGRARRAR